MTIGFPKPRPRLLEKRDAAAKAQTTDRAENEKARTRAGGCCEVQEVVAGSLSTFVALRCWRRDSETHHLIGGIGRRNKGKSILAAYKLRVCKRCHEEITGHVLVPTTAEHTAATVRYRRVK